MLCLDGTYSRLPFLVPLALSLDVFVCLPNKSPLYCHVFSLCGSVGVELTTRVNNTYR